MSMKKDTTLSLLKEIRDLLKKQAPIPEFAEPKAEKPGYIRLDMKYHMTAEWLIAECQKKFDVWVFDESWLKGVTSERKGEYTVYFKDVQEADEENKNKSADDLKAEGHKGITLEERLALELVYFEKYGKHLDDENITLCTGSRNSGGSVPRVDWRRSHRELYVDWCDVHDRGRNVRSRSAVKIEK